MGKPTFKEAAAFELLFGQFKGQKLDDIAKTDRGLQYLDWLRGQMAKTVRPDDSGPVTYAYLCAYLDDATIAKDLAELVKARR